MSKTEKELPVINENELELVSGGKLLSELPADIDPNATIWFRLIQTKDKNGNPLPKEISGPWMEYNGPESLKEISERLATGCYRVDYIIR